MSEAYNDYPGVDLAGPMFIKPNCLTSKNARSQDAKRQEAQPFFLNARSQEAKLQEAQPKVLESEFQRNNTILIKEENAIMAVVKCIYDVFHDLRVGCRKKQKEFKVLGSYVYSLDNCTFEAQLWRLKDTNQLAYELKLKSISGLIAFTNLVQSVAWSLKENGYAERMADENEILMPYTMMSWNAMDDITEDEC